MMTGELMGYASSPSVRWERTIDDAATGRFKRELGAIWYKFQSVTLAGFHALNFSMFALARHYATDGMAAYARLQEKEFASAESAGYAAVRHQRFVGTGYFDEVAQAIANGASSTVALAGSTEAEQFVF